MPDRLSHLQETESRFEWICEACGVETDKPTHVLSDDRQTEATYCAECAPEEA